MTYDFVKQKYFGTHNNEMVCMNKRGEIKNLQKLPIIKTHSDGGGIFPLEEFVSYPEKIRFITDTRIALIYTFSIMVFDLEKQIIEAAYYTESNPVKTFCIIDSETICFSAGINTYVIDLRKL